MPDRVNGFQKSTYADFHRAAEELVVLYSKNSEKTLSIFRFYDNDLLEIAAVLP